VPPFTPLSDTTIFQNYVKGELEKVYLGDDESCDIVGKGIVMEKYQMAQR